MKPTERAAALRQEVDRCIAAAEPARAQALLRHLWRSEPGPKTAGFVLSRFETLRPAFNLLSCRIAILRSYTVETVVPVLRAAAIVNGIDLTVWVGDFNAYTQEILDESSGLYSFAPDIVLLAIQTRDVAPNLWKAFADFSAADAASAMSETAGFFEQLVSTFRKNSKAHLILHSLELPSFASQGVLDTQAEASQVATIRDLNEHLSRLTRKYPGVFVLDYDAVVARHGRQNWHDESKWLTARMPIRAENLIHLANEWLRFIHPLTGKICKVLVTDLDNTLWGGVIGEDGMSGIQVGSEYTGAAYLAVQRVLLDLYHRGIILAVCSKNNAAQAIEALEQHPAMLLRPRHFAALRINWNDKATNLQEIARELNVGIDSIALLDDNPAEREWVQSNLPEVTVIDLPQDPMYFANTIRESPVFERLTLTSDDRQRTRYYAEERLRTELRSNSYSLVDFYRSLGMEAEIFSPNSQTVARIAQLTQKTNQFNLTTKRYTEQEIVRFTDTPDWAVYAIRLLDKFGDNGLVGVSITHRVNDICEIDSFLLSCRVIGRTVETAFLAAIADSARRSGAKRMVGWFVPTRANAIVKEFYPSHEFVCTSDGTEKFRWEFDLTQRKIAAPEWIKINVAEQELAQ